MRAQVDARPSLLVVDPRPEARRLACTWLEEAGMRVIECAGPHEPEYVCPWAKGGSCPLPNEADVIVLNLWLESDTLMRGTPGEEVLTYYLSLGKPVVALAGWEDSVHPISEETVVVIQRPASREDLLRAVRSLLPSRSHVGP